MYKNKYHNPIMIDEGVEKSVFLDYKEAEKELRKVASDLSGFYSIVNDKHNLETVIRDLIGISNSIIISEENRYECSKFNRELEQEILEKLNIKLL